MSAVALVGLGGSLRRGSYNRGLLRAAAELAPPEVELQLASIAEIPLYDADRERERGIPDAVAELKDRIAGADGMVLATPEYANAVPGYLKNAVDWLSRPPDDRERVWEGLPVGVIGAGGGGGTRFSQAAWLPTLRWLRTRPWFGSSLYVARAWEHADEAGDLTDPQLRERLGRWMEGFAAFCRTCARAERER